jgi:hypothetical protein
MKSLALAVALLLCLSFAAVAWAVLARLVRQEIRRTDSGEQVLVCVYDAGGREIERVYPIGNFCPKYAEE